MKTEITQKLIIKLLRQMKAFFRTLHIDENGLTKKNPENICNKI